MFQCLSLPLKNDYSNNLLVYQENTFSAEDGHNVGKPHSSADLAKMREKIASSKIDFNVVGYIEDNPNSHL